MNISPARAAAFDVLMQIETQKAFSSVLLPLYEEKLSLLDRGLCHALTLGVLRRQIYLDKIVEQFAKGKRNDVAVQIALRLGLYQLLFLDKVPPHAAINESVNLVKRAKKSSAKGYVNAILRRSTREDVLFQFSDDVERISVETSHPRWLIEKWIGEFGLEEAVQIASANNEIPAAAFRLIDKSSENEILNARRSEFVEGCFISETIDETLLELADKRKIYFQDEASQMVAASFRLHNKARFLDVCAAPGGKTTIIAEREISNSPFIAAGDLHWPRLMFLRENIRNQGVGPLNLIQYNAVDPLPFEDQSFDTVLVDPPCSGTGTIQHNPEIRYFLNAADFVDLQSKQLSILQNASKLVNKGGALVYSTCSMDSEENEAVCNGFLSDNTEFSIEMPNVPERFIADRGYARTYPHRDGMDGFFLAVFRRT